MLKGAVVFAAVALIITPSQPCDGKPGTACWGRNRYVQYQAGTLPIVVSVPHGGSLVPATIPDRRGTTVTDLKTIELGQALARAFERRTGQSPHLILCLLKRTKLDANRELADAAQGNAEAAHAWTDYHGFIELAIANVRARTGRGFYIDLHGHGHAKQRLELGYLMNGTTLALNDGALDSNGHRAKSSLRAAPTSAPLSELVRGKTSLGALLGSRFPSVPSPLVPAPGGDPYFGGGYSTARHTEHLPGVQIEANFTGVRDTELSRAAFAETLVEAITTFAAHHLGVSISGRSAGL